MCCNGKRCFIAGFSVKAIGIGEARPREEWHRDQADDSWSEYTAEVCFELSELAIIHPLLGRRQIVVFFAGLRFQYTWILGKVSIILTYDYLQGGFRIMNTMDSNHRGLPFSGGRMGSAWIYIYPLWILGRCTFCCSLRIIYGEWGSGFGRRVVILRNIGNFYKWIGLIVIGEGVTVSDQAGALKNSWKSDSSKP